MAQRPDEVRPHEAEPGLHPDADFSRRETEHVIPVRTEQERQREIEVEQIEKKILEAEQSQPEQVAETPQSRPAIAAAQPAIDPVTKEIEKILSNDLSSMYQAMTPAQQEIFRREGERTATAIRQLVESVKMKTSTLLDLIKKWLRLIPGVNKFLEQEAKIKTDKVMALHDTLHGPQS